MGPDVRDDRGRLEVIGAAERLKAKGVGDQRRGAMGLVDDDLFDKLRLLDGGVRGIGA